MSAAAASSKRTLNELSEKERHFIYRKCLLDTATDGNLPEMKRTIADHSLSREDINKARDLYGRTAVILASMSGHLACVEYLVSKGARVNVQDKTGWTALSWAARSGHLDTIKFLSSNGAHLDTHDVFGLTAITYAANYDNRQAVEYLVARGAAVPQDQLAQWPKPVAEAVKRGQRNLVIDDEKKKRTDRSGGMSIAKKTLLPLAAVPGGANAQAEKERQRTDILTAELRVLEHSDCNCALKLSRKCTFFAAEADLAEQGENQGESGGAALAPAPSGASAPAASA